MIELPLADAVETALHALLADRLSILAGAGLSMAPPSSLPSAATIASLAKAAYEAKFGPAPFGDDISEQADHFFRSGELVSLYLRTLVDKDAFAGHPNEGHYAVADLILIGALQTACTTNIDTMIETAGQLLYGHVESGVDANAMALVPAGVTPLLKIHGCRQFDLATTVWSALQLAGPPISDRIAGSANWLTHRLANRDLLIVGYWTDWDYLNQVLASVVGAVAPARVIVVNPADAAMLAAKAPHLMALGGRATVQFVHVRCLANEFLEPLRLAFSKSFYRQILASGIQEFVDLKGAVPDPAWLVPPDLSNDAYWQVRRDLEGCPPAKPAKERQPGAGPLMGLTLLQLRAVGAIPDGATWSLGGRRIRLIRAEGKVLHRVQAAFAREMAPIVASDVIVAVGAENLGLPPYVPRAGGPATITRGATSRWLTRLDAVTEFAL
ncbi:MAG: hypothetical protein U1F58_09715 [Burkholderiales bacterium]